MNDDILEKRRKDAATIARILRNGDICNTCYLIPQDCTCPGKNIDSEGDPLRSTEWWEQRDELAGIRDYARAAGANPAAVLAVTLMRVLAQTPHTVTLPGIIGGGAGSLNLFAALVGTSGRGKGAATSASRTGILFPTGEMFDELPPGSAEGLVKSYAAKTTDDETGEERLEWRSRSILFDVPEISDLAGQMGRSGSVLTGQLLSAFSGERLGFSYAGANGVKIPRHEYRFAMVAGVQPAASGALLDDGAASKGLPQRFIWATTADPDAPDFTLDALKPRPITLHLPAWPITGGTVSVDDGILYTIGQNHRINLRGSGAGLDGHRLFAQLKIAAALAFMRGSKHVTAGDWEIAADVMTHSDIARQTCVATLERLTVERAEQKGRERAATAASEEASVYEAIRSKLLDRFRRDPHVTASQLAQSVRGPRRQVAYQVIDDLAGEYPDFPGRQVA